MKELEPYRKPDSDYYFFDCPACGERGFVNPDAGREPNPPRALAEHWRKRHEPRGKSATRKRR